MLEKYLRMPLVNDPIFLNTFDAPYLPNGAPDSL